VQSSQVLEILIIVLVQSGGILNPPPYLQVLSGTPENALADSESTVLNARAVWEHQEELRSTGEVAHSVWEDWVLLLDQFTFG
jgi:hypothetical protein